MHPLLAPCITTKQTVKSMSSCLFRRKNFLTKPAIKREKRLRRESNSLKPRPCPRAETPWGLFCSHVSMLPSQELSADWSAGDQTAAPADLISAIASRISEILIMSMIPLGLPALDWAARTLFYLVCSSFQTIDTKMVGSPGEPSTTCHTAGCGWANNYQPQTCHSHRPSEKTIHKRTARFGWASDYKHDTATDCPSRPGPTNITYCGLQLGVVEVGVHSGVRVDKPDAREQPRVRRIPEVPVVPVRYRRVRDGDVEVGEYVAGHRRARDLRVLAPVARYLHTR
jgi:hypothetical protein